MDDENEKKIENSEQADKSKKIEDDESENSLSKCKAINSSYINLKRNNLLINYTISK